ncbi:maleylpyruvate isomerase N-terminal domain-containing protein [Leucobacter sp. L43]|uniref:maleylpyruvate isomerase N-terminal domain-containing protein n=1 Tax=Leucobacter sp. L43 TaxID=2798040 RepID=UPI0019080464|nr:maleylpyruvate isomerase N-terminal domain-containing protein [Leucobacter sp. L43]
MHEGDGIVESRTEFAAATAWAVSVVDGVPDTRWRSPGLGDWDLRALVGHTSRALLTVERGLAAPLEVDAVGGAEQYFARASGATAASGASVSARGVEAGTALGEDPALRFAEIAARVLGAVRDAGDPIVSTVVGGMRLSAYLRTRTFELIVHGLDICEAVRAASDTASTRTGPPDEFAEPPTAPLLSTMRLAGALAVGNGDGREVLRALTGRGELRSGYSVLARPREDRSTSAQSRDRDR